MGVIQRQTIKGTVYSYIGVLLGFVNLVLLSPKIFTTDEIGVTQLMVAMAVIMAQISSLGFNNVTVRLFPYFRNKDQGHHGYPGLGLIVSLSGFILFLIFMVLARSFLIEQNSDKSELFARYIDWLIPLVLFLIFFNFFDTYARVLYKAALGSFLRDVLMRSLNFILIIAFYFGRIDFGTYLKLFIITYCVAAALLFLYLLYNGHISLTVNFSFINATLRKDMIMVALFGLIAGLSGVAKLSFDKLMVKHYLDLSSVGIYSIAFYFGTLILIPYRAMSKISSTVIAEAWKDNNLTLIHEVYKKSSINQVVFGMFVFLIVWLNTDSMLIYLPDIYSTGKYVILFIAISNLFEVTSGVNIQIILTSRYYRYNTWFMILLLVSIIISNIILIPLYGINGAALATLFSSFIYTLSRIIFLLVRYRMLPFSWKHIYVVLITIILLFTIGLVPHLANWLVDILMRTVIISIFYLVLNLIFSTSEELKNVFYTVMNTIFRKK